MVSHLFFYQLTLIAFVWLCVMLQWAWPSDSVAACPSTLNPTPPRPKRHRAPKPFAGFITKSAEKPRHLCRGWIGVGRAGLNAQEPNKTHAVPEPSMGEGTAEVEAPAFMPGRTSPALGGFSPLETR